MDKFSWWDVGEETMTIPLIPITLSLSPLASPASLCPPPAINLTRDVSRQLSSQSLLSLLRYRSVLCYRLSWLLSPRYWCFCLGERKKVPRPWIYRGGSFSNDLQSPRNENGSCQAVAFIQWYCCWISQWWKRCIRGESCGIAERVMGH